MKIVITGASGYVGTHLISHLAAAGAEILVVGRTPDALRQPFPDHAVCSYEDLAKEAKGFDVLIHLATANTTSQLDRDAVFAVNVDLLRTVAEAAKTAGIARFINVSSTHALDAKNKSSYADSKRAGQAALAEVQGQAAETVYLPFVYGAGAWSGKLAFLNAWPTRLAKAAFRPLAALKPTVDIKTLADFCLGTHTGYEFSQGQILLCDDQQANLYYTTAKRMLDLLFAISIIIFAGWVMGLMWIAIRLESKGPSIFAQTRVGKDGKTFTCYKFRTMQQGTKQAGTHEVSAASVTRLGHIMRKTKIDELPQIWNILCNQMALIGPRPCLPNQVELVEARTQHGALSVKPGISGLGQISGVDMSTPQKLARLDGQYVRLQSLVFDLKIIIATARGSGQGDNTSA